MLVIGHRGARGLAPENTLESLRAGLDAGADMLEFDVRLTRDKVLVMVHDFHTYRTHKSLSIISQLTFDQLQKRTDADPIVRLSDVLDEFFGIIMLNIEIKSRGAGKLAAELLKNHYIKRSRDWDNVMFSSFKASELTSIRHASDHVNLALLTHLNPFAFIPLHKQIELTAVGFHRLYANALVIEIAKQAHLFTYVYTVNRPEAARMLTERGIDGVVTDRPDIILNDIKKHAH